MTKRRVLRHVVTQPDDPSYLLIPLTQGQNALVDLCDYEWLTQWNWCARWCPTTQSFIAMRGTRSDGTILMHRAIINCSETEECDHKNHNTLDNRRDNLRKCDRTQSMANRRTWNSESGFKGVGWHKPRNLWHARIQHGGKVVSLGYFASREDAALAYDEAARKFFGEFAMLNFP